MLKRSRDDLALHVVHALGLIAVLSGLLFLRETDIGADLSTAAAGIASQLPSTLPAAVLILLAGVLQLAAGAVIFWEAAGSPPRGLGQAALGGVAGAVVLDTFLLATLGSIKAFDWPALLLANGIVLAYGAMRRGRRLPRLARSVRRADFHDFTPFAWALVGMVWAGPVLLQLASPVVPFMDVLPNHVTAVEHLRVFGGLATLDTIPSPINGPSRIFFGYQATVGALAATTDVPAVTAVAALALPLTVLVALAGRGVAGAIAGAPAARWALLTVPLSVTFLRIGDGRAGVMAFVLAGLAFWLVLEPRGRTIRRRSLVLGVTLGAAILVHPGMGLLATATVGLTAVGAVATGARTRAFAVYALPAAITAPVLALPQWAANAALELPPWTALLAGPLAASVMLTSQAVLERVRWRTWPTVEPRRVVALAVASVVGLLAAGQIIAPAAIDHVADTAVVALAWYPVLIVGGAVAVLLAPGRPGMHVVYAGLVVTVLAGAVAEVVPTGSQLGDSIRFEVPKTITYFAPTLLAVAAAVGLADVWSRRNWHVAGRFTATAAFLVAAALPIRSEVVEALSLGEHRLSESLSISLRHAGRGYWQGFPHPRFLINAQQRELVESIQSEIAAGRLTDTTHVLHVARSFQPWVAAPLAAFTGVLETTATLDPEHSIHTADGRLRDLGDLEDLLRQDFGYVVIEPAGLEPAVSTRVQAAGYRPIFVNDGGSVWALEVTLR